jgi:hypothetical protein
MKSDERRWTQMRRRAQGRLPADFAAEIMRRAQETRKAGRSEYVLIAATAMLCLVSVAVANWYLGDLIQHNNLARWRVAEAQLQALREAL